MRFEPTSWQRRLTVCLLTAATPSAAWAQATATTPPASRPAASPVSQGGAATTGAPAATGSATPTPATGTPATAPAPESSGSQLRDAQEHLLRGLEHFRARRFLDAIHEFQLANSAAPSADLWFNIANAYEQLGQAENAVDYYRRYLRDKVDPPDRAEVERRITELQRLAEQQRRQQLQESSDANVQFAVTLPPRPSGSAAPSLYVDNRLLGTVPLPGFVTLTPGPHEVRLVGPGIQEWHGTVRARPGDPTVATITALGPTSYRTRAGGHLLSYITGGLGIVSLGIGGYYGITAASQDAFDMAGMPNAIRRDNATTADVLFGVGAGLVLTAVIMYFIEAGSSRTERIEAPAAPPAPPPVRAATTAPTASGTSPATTSAAAPAVH